MPQDLPPIDELPAAHLSGRILNNGWIVGDMIDRKGATGANFSIPYVVTHPAKDRVGFLKAMNVVAALKLHDGNLMDTMGAFVEAYTFERDLMNYCTENRMNRVIKLWDFGETEVPEAGILSTVPYLILEIADGDLHAYQNLMSSFDLAWVMRVLKHVALGIEQLHAAQAAHQDLKPSNVLTQDDGREMKLGDLGRAEWRGTDGPATGLTLPGAVAYAPPEQLYGDFDHSWELRRAADLYHLGSLAVQLCLGHNITTLIQQHLPEPMRCSQWQGPFSEVLPYLNTAHGQVLHLFRAEIEIHSQSDQFVNDLVLATRQLTEPDPRRRGHPKDRAARTSSFGVRRYVSLFNMLFAKSELQLKTKI